MGARGETSEWAISQTVVLGEGEGLVFYHVSRTYESQAVNCLAATRCGALSTTLLPSAISLTELFPTPRPRLRLDRIS